MAIEIKYLDGTIGEGSAQPNVAEWKCHCGENIGMRVFDRETNIECPSCRKKYVVFETIAGGVPYQVMEIE